MTRRLILTTSDTGAGHLNLIRRGRVFALQHRLVTGPAPALEDIGAFFAQRQSLHQLDPSQFGTWVYESEESTAPWFEELLARWDEHEGVEFWVDPAPNAQLILIQVLHWMSRQNLDLEKFSLVHAEGQLGCRTDDDPRSLNPALVQVGARHLQLACLAWAAFRQPTPEHWARLLHDDLCLLPFLRPTVLRMLEELPAESTALSASELGVLGLVSRGSEASDILRAFAREPDVPLLEYWEIGKEIDFLAASPNAVIVGLADGPFDLVLRDDRERHRRYLSSCLSLSRLGKELLEGREDLARHKRICRWWGGTKLTNENCWRWRSREQVLLAPI